MVAVVVVVVGLGILGSGNWRLMPGRFREDSCWWRSTIGAREGEGEGDGDGDGEEEKEGDAFKALKGRKWR